MNQLQKDIETLLQIADKYPKLLTGFEYNAIDRLRHYIKGDYDYCKMEMRTLLENAYANERTDIGKNTIRQLLEAIQ